MKPVFVTNIPNKKTLAVLTPLLPSHQNRNLPLDPPNFAGSLRSMLDASRHTSGTGLADARTKHQVWFRWHRLGPQPLQDIHRSAFRLFGLSGRQISRHHVLCWIPGSPRLSCDTKNEGMTEQIGWDVATFIEFAKEAHLWTQNSRRLRWTWLVTW